VYILVGAAEGALTRHPILFNEQVPSAPRIAEGLQQGILAWNKSPVSMHAEVPFRELLVSTAQMNLKESVTEQVAPETQVKPPSHPPPRQILVPEDTEPLDSGFLDGEKVGVTAVFVDTG